MSIITILLALGIIVYVVGQQIAGANVTGRRVVLLPGILTVIGVLDVTGHNAHASGTDYAFIAASAVVAVAIGLGLGAMTRIELRNGALWTQLPKSGLWLWAAFIITRVGILVAAHAAGAHVAGSTDAILLSLGLNRAAQAAVVVPRAIAAGIPFAPERDGKVFGASWFEHAGR